MALKTNKMRMTPTQLIADRLATLLIAEAQFLQAANWLPCAPSVPGGPVRWKSPRSSVLFSQDKAVELEKVNQG